MFAFSSILKRRADASAREAAFIAVLLGCSAFAVVATVIADVRTTEETISVR